MGSVSHTLRRQLARIAEQDERANLSDLYTQEEIEAVYDRIREYQRTGEPGKANALKTKLYAGELIEAAEYTMGPVTSTKPGLSAEELTPPTEFGKGSGQSKWAQFAVTVSELDPEVVRQMGRDDIIDALKEIGVYHPDDDLPDADADSDQEGD